MFGCFLGMVSKKKQLWRQRWKPQSHEQPQGTIQVKLDVFCGETHGEQNSNEQYLNFEKDPNGFSKDGTNKMVQFDNPMVLFFFRTCCNHPLAPQ
jgi:hypothetical protein